MKRIEFKKKLNLGCGKSIKQGWVNLDINEGDGIDVVHDLNILPLPFDIETFDHILCENILEHVNYIPLMNDLYRILKKGGFLNIRVPHFTSKSNYADPSHIHYFSSKTFNYFVRNYSFSYERNFSLFSNIKKKIVFEGFRILFLKTFYWKLENWVNKSNRHKEFYERSFLRIFPAVSLEVILMK